MAAKANTAAAAPDRLSLRRLLPLIALLAVPVFSYATGLYRYFSLDVLAQYHSTLKTWIASHELLAILIYVIVYAVITAVSLPAGALVTISGGLLFGWLVGGSAAIIGATIGASVVFLIARSSLGSGLVAAAGPWLEKLSEGFRKDAFNYLLFLRLVPAIPFCVVNLVPAILGMSFWSYVAGTFIGIIPGTLAFAYVGTGLESVITAATEGYQACLAGKSAAEAAQCHIMIDAGKLLTREIVIALAALAAISLLPIVIKRFVGGRAAA
jgi:uncharacterized membrane protein YdjX (TVP38/TMEM64 family)